MKSLLREGRKEGKEHFGFFISQNGQTKKRVAENYVPGQLSGIHSALLTTDICKVVEK